MAAAEVWLMCLNRVAMGTPATGQPSARRVQRNQPTPDWAIYGAKSRNITSRFVRQPELWMAGNLSGAGRTSVSENRRNRRMHTRTEINLQIQVVPIRVPSPLFWTWLQILVNEVMTYDYSSYFLRRNEHDAKGTRAHHTFSVFGSRISDPLMTPPYRWDAFSTLRSTTFWIVI